MIGDLTRPVQATPFVAKMIRAAGDRQISDCATEQWLTFARDVPSAKKIVEVDETENNVIAAVG
jgi:hypothetical protein